MIGRQQHLVLPRLIVSGTAIAMAVAALLISSAGPAKAGTSSVAIINFSFKPSSVTVAVGDTVEWTNNDGVAHTVTEDHNAWTSGELSQGQTYSQTFTQAGTFTYHCAIHPSMKGSVTVSGGSAATATPTATATATPTATATATATPTATATRVPSSTPVPTSTATVVPTATLIPTATSSPSAVPATSAPVGATVTPTPTRTAVPTSTVVATPANTPTPTPTLPATATTVPTATATSSASALPDAGSLLAISREAMARLSGFRIKENASDRDGRTFSLGGDVASARHAERLTLRVTRAGHAGVRTAIVRVASRVWMRRLPAHTRWRTSKVTRLTSLLSPIRDPLSGFIPTSTPSAPTVRPDTSGTEAVWDIGWTETKGATTTVTDLLIGQDDHLVHGGTRVTDNSMTYSHSDDHFTLDRLGETVKIVPPKG